jgi:hypothetical protein
MKALIILPTLLTIFLGCGKKCYMTAPSPLYFSLKEKGQSLSEELLNKLKLSYFENSEMKYDPCAKKLTDFKIMMIPGIDWLSKKGSIKEFYLEYPDNTRDTIYANFRTRKTECDDMYELAEPLRFNGKVVDRFDTTVLKGCRVYVFEK